MNMRLNNQVERIRNNFIRSLPQRLDKIQRLAQQLVAGQYEATAQQHMHAQRELLVLAGQNLTMELHKLRGFSGGNGFEHLAQLSGVAEEIADVFHYSNYTPTAEDKSRLQNAINALILHSHTLKERPESEVADVTAPQQPMVDDTPLILIVDDDKEFCDILSLQLTHLGYRTRYIYDLSELEQSINLYKPNAICMDIIFNGERDAGLEVIQHLSDKNCLSCPIIYLSARDDINARLQAVRSHGSGFLGKSFSLGDLNNILDFVVPRKKVSCKVLIIDDDKISTEFSKAILEHASMQVATLDNPEMIFEAITKFDPDLILLDMYMPEISGFELACVIRQHVNFASIPIVIMSSETDVNKQIAMRSAGADDFILKPFKPYHLVNTIQNRIQRSRQVKRLIYTDGLTGLTLFPKVKEQILILIESCLRYNLEFTLALVDLDNFKQVNDKYGHLVGDQVLRNFAELALSRMRKSDLITRYGGEEFAIIYPYTTINKAEIALNDLRENFAQHMNASNAGTFNVTFSAGIASIHKYQDLSSLLEAADKALYQAKSSGHNKIIRA